jgi:hypothetical protein
VTQENQGGRGWGIGVGLVLGIILALLSLLRLPFIGSPGLRSADALMRAADMVDDRLGERSLSNSDGRNDRDVPQPELDWTKTAVQADDAARDAPTGPRQKLALDRSDDTSGAHPPALNADMAKTGSPAESDVPRLPVEAPRPTFLPPMPSPSEDAVAGEDSETLLQHARFLIKAGLAPMAPEPLRKIVNRAPGTPIAREAQRELDSLSRN